MIRLLTALLLGLSLFTPARTHEAPVTFAAVGDSITAQDFQGARYPWQSWVPAASSHLTQYVGGWAEPGRTTADMLAGSVPIDADVLVILGGVNDVNLGIPTETTLANLDSIQAATGIPIVVVAALPPNDRNPAASVTYNAALKHHAAAQGWTFIDPWKSVREPDGTWSPGAAWDDLHPVADVAHMVGITLQDTIRKAGTL